MAVLFSLIRPLFFTIHRAHLLQVLLLLPVALSRTLVFGVEACLVKPSWYLALGALVAP